MYKGFEVGLFDELAAIYPDTEAKQGEKFYEVMAASGTYAGVHILVSGLKAGEIVTIEVKGENTHYRLFEMIPVPVEENTGVISRTERLGGGYNPDVIRRAPFMIYEVLKPIRNIMTSKGNSVAIAFRNFVEVETNKEQLWEIYVTVGGLTQKVTFRVEAKAVQIPLSGETTHKYVNWIGLDKIAQFHHVPVWSEAWKELVKKYLKLARYGRQNIAWLPLDYYFELDGDNQPKLDTNKLDELIKLVDEAGLYWLQGAAVSGRKGNDWLAKEAEVILTHETIPGKGEKTLADIMTQLYSYLEEKGLKERWIQSFFDEPLDESSETYKIGVAIIKQTMPGIPVLEANKSTETIEGSLDIWCPTVDCYEKDIEFYKKRVEAGDKVWVYTCLEPTGPYLNRLLDMERMKPLLIAWVNSLYPVEGFLHWGGNHFSVNPYEQSCVCMSGEEYTDFKLPYPSQLPAGDCGVIYPGDFMGLSTTRLEAHRIGFEDLYLIEKIKEKDATRAREIVEMIARGYKDYETDIKLYRKVKQLLIQEIERLEV